MLAALRLPIVIAFALTARMVLLHTDADAQRYRFSHGAGLEPNAPLNVASISFTTDGDLLLSVTQEARVLRLTNDGSVAPFEWPALSESAKPVAPIIAANQKNGVAIFDPNASVLWVNDGGEQTQAEVAFTKSTKLVFGDDGDLYALAKDEVVVMSRLARTKTRLRLPDKPLKKPVDLAINSAGEVHVLDAMANVHVFHPSGRHMRSHLASLRSDDARIATPAALVAFSDGGFAIADQKTCVVVLFDPYGRKTGLLGSRGQGAPGTFKSIDALAWTGAPYPQIAIADRTSNTVQVFSAERAIGVLEPDGNKPSMHPRPYFGAPVKAAVNTTNNGWAMLPADDPTGIICFDEDRKTARFALSGIFKNAVAIAADREGNLYVADAGRRQIVVLDRSGVQLRSFGHQGGYKLGSPTGVVVQSNGTVVVCDSKRKSLTSWTSEGVFEREILPSNKVNWKAPTHLAIDSKDRLYVLDLSSNEVYRTGSNGWPLSLQRIKLRGAKPGTKNGEMAGLIIDRFDQLYTVNKSTGELEVYTWDDVEPELFFRQGERTALPDGFTNTGYLSIDNELFRLFFTANKDASTVAFDFIVTPPTPDDDYNFFIADGTLVVTFQPLNQSYITGYVLLNEARETVVNAVEPRFRIETDEPLSDRPRHYRLASVSRLVQSSPSDGFVDYYSHAMGLLAAKRYDEALTAAKNAIDRMGRNASFRNFMAHQLSATGEHLANSGDIQRAMPYLRLAHSTAPDDPQTIAGYQVGYAAYFRELLAREDLQGIIAEASRLSTSTVLGPIVLASLDSISHELERTASTLSLSRAIMLRRKMVDWAPSNPSYRSALGTVLFSYYGKKYQEGATLAELEGLLGEAERFLVQGVGELSATGKSSERVELTLIDVLIAQERYSEAEQRILTALNNRLKPTASSWPYRLKLSTIYEQRKQYDLSVEQYELVIAETPQNAQHKALYGEALARAGRHDDARKVFEKLLINDRSNAEFTAAIGRIELMRKNYIEAAYQFDRALRFDASRTEWHGLLAEALERSSNSTDALVHYRAAARHEENQLDFYKNRMADMRKAANAKERLIGHLEGMARIFELTGRAEERVAALERLVQLDTDRAEFYYNLGLGYLAVGLVYDAEKSLYRATRLAPENGGFAEAHERALKTRTSTSKSSAPLSIVNVRLNEVFPSLYRNYADPDRLPIGEMVLANNTDGIIIPTEISITIPGVMPSPTRVQPQNLVGFANTTVRLNAIFDEAAVMAQTEDQRLQARIVLTYSHKGTTKKLEHTEPIVIHGRNTIHWADKRRLGSFISPVNEELMAFNTRVNDQLDEERDAGINEALIQSLRVYTALEALGLRYAPDAANNYAVVSVGEGKLDRVHYPTETLVRRRGDCDDFVAVFTGLLENAGVQTGYIDVPGHVFVAVNTGLRPHELTQAGLARNEVIIDQGTAWIPLETTLIGEADFIDAWMSGVARYQAEIKRGVFPELIPMADARKRYAPASFVPNAYEAPIVIDAQQRKRYAVTAEKLRSRLKNEALLAIAARYQREPGNVFVKNKYAVLLAKNGEHDRAEGVLLEALELSPKSATVLNNLGNVATLKGDWVRAINFYNQAFKVKDNDPEVCLNLYTTYLKAGDKQQADVWLAKAVELEPTIQSKYDTY